MTLDDLAREVVKLPGWRWMPGMLTEHGNRYVSEGRYPRRSVLPDLTDPATSGCLLALLGPWIRQVLPPRWAGEPWRIFWHDPTGPTKDWATGATFAEACVRVALALGRWPGGGS